MTVKRVVSVFFCLVFSLALLMLRLYVLSAGTAQSAQAGGTLTVEAARSRGFLYDRSGLPFVNETSVRTVVAAPTPSAPQLLQGVTRQRDFSAALSRWSRGLPAVVPVTGEVSGAGLFTAMQPVRYAERFLIPHLAGYCDAAGHGVCGLEKSYDDLLSERVCRVTFDVDAAGRVLCGGETRVTDEGVASPRGVELTLDKRMQAAVREGLLQSDVRKGSAVLLDAENGEILALCSVPEYDPSDVGARLDDPDAPFVDRALQSVSVGSVYKIIVAAALLEHGVGEGFTYVCTGETVQNDVTFHCHLRTGHGALTMPDALYHSCNTWFIHAAKQIPVSEILDLSWKLGLGSAVTLAPELSCSAGIVPDEAELATDAARANLAFGQGRLTAAPVQIAAATAACVNGGVYYEPRLVRALIGDDGARSETAPSQGTRVLRRSTSDALREMLVYAASETKRLTFKDCGGKTATAQTGVYRGGEEQLGTWYSGFFPAQEPRYVLTVFCEDGTSGAADCIPVFESIALKIRKKP